MWLVASLWDSPTAKAPNEKSPNFRKHQNQHEGVVKTQPPWGLCFTPLQSLTTPIQSLRFSNYEVRVPEFALRTSVQVILMLLAHTLRATKLSTNVQIVRTECGPRERSTESM